MRLAVLDRDVCSPDKCQRECYRFCPGVRMGEKTIEFDSEGYPSISEVLCTGSGICVRKCPFKAIKIINLPDQLTTELINQYGANGFRLFRLPNMNPGTITGIVGKNGTGKSTALKILYGEMKPNFGGEREASEEEVLDFYRGTALHRHFKGLYDGEIKIAYKPQAVYLLPKVSKGKVGKLLKNIDERGLIDQVVVDLGIEEALNKDIGELSGGELQRVAIAATSLRDSSVYFFDEPSSFNDVYQRMAVARFIRKLVRDEKSVLVVEHDIAILDYMSDTICIVYGEPGAYGIFTRPESVRTGINIFLDGYIPRDNIRFRRDSIEFERRAPVPEAPKQTIVIENTELTKKWHDFELTADPGKIYMSEVLGILGPNATGKTTLIKMLSRELDPDSGDLIVEVEGLSYKPQYIQTDFEGTVQQYLREKAGHQALSGQAVNLLIEPLNMKKLLERSVLDLSGGELQKLQISSCLLREADVYLLDEPSAFIDVEDRLTLASAINRFIKFQDKTAVVVDHDLILIDLVADRIIVFDGEPGIRGHALSPTNKREAFNIFLRSIAVTVRRDPRNGRPRINKPESRLDREQRSREEYYYVSPEAIG
ncbi:MAG: ribosome biogenesis/translation initiation ATPase RLI [Nitrososphaeria archaeon]|nr:ribosome biogenesis/translation initiation ATPase RLI [Nitrososphaeria archaeon]NIN51770.1 ribosome biogenesis/translation initiation ATPase RLI [Nitrososphaeria archaeon]NIQ32275.1 ribosome biogenesis/translation initiation ATPase RLI [Nitrososphaeria archaeon]